MEGGGQGACVLLVGAVNIQAQHRFDPPVTLPHSLGVRQPVGRSSGGAVVTGPPTGTPVLSLSRWGGSRGDYGLAAGKICGDSCICAVSST